MDAQNKIVNHSADQLNDKSINQSTDQQLIIHRFLRMSAAIEPMSPVSGKPDP